MRLKAAKSSQTAQDLDGLGKKIDPERSYEEKSETGTRKRELKASYKETISCSSLRSSKRVPRECRKFAADYQGDMAVNGRWTKEEHKQFLESIRLYGKDWKKIEEHIGTRSCSQIRSHAQKYFLRLEKENNFSQNGALDVTGDLS